jgi:glucose-6-phosphate isomerase
MRLQKFLHDNHEKFNNHLTELHQQKFLERILNKDFTLWSDKPDEITNRLDWLFSPEEYLPRKDELENFAKEIKSENFEHVLLLGMGGSSLAPEVFQSVFGNFASYPELFVLDSTHPEQIKITEEKINLEKTLFVVSTKSGGTVETLSLMKYFFAKVKRLFGEDAGKRFVAITDPGSKLEKIANEFSFRKIFLNNPNIGGRFSALSLFGLVPAALIGVDLKKLLSMAKRFSEETINLENFENNYALKLGVFLGMYAEEGKDKLTMLFAGKTASVANWTEQLVAESTGKHGKGILPVSIEKAEIPARYARDRIFVYVYLEGEDSHRLEIENLKRNGFPVSEIALDDIYELGALFYLWEFATAVAGHIMKINPFDQPDVESAKVAAREMTAEYLKIGELPDAGEGVFYKNSVYFPKDKVKPLNELLPAMFCKISECLDNYLGRNYISIHAYIARNVENERKLADFALYLFKKYNVAVTVGFGPRFLHSTGQLHKGDGGNGIFIQIADKPEIDLPIPNEMGSDNADMTFDTLIRAQSLGDRKALISKGRKILRVEFFENLEKTLSQIIEILEKS